MVLAPNISTNRLLRHYISCRIPFLEPAGHERLAEHWDKIYTLDRGERLEHNGGETHIYFIEDGCIKLASETAEKELIYAFAWEEQCVFNLPRFLSDQHEGTYLEAVRKSRMRAISKKDFLALMEHFPEIKDFWNKSLTLNLLERFEREDLLLHTKPLERLRQLLQKEPDVLDRVPQVHVAAYLGIRPETLNRLLHLDFNQGED